MHMPFGRFCHELAHFSWLVCLEFNGPVNTIKVLSSRQFTLPHFSWACLGLLEVNQYLCIFIFQKLTTAIVESVEGENDHRKYFMINLHEKNVARPGWNRTHNLLITNQVHICLLVLRFYCSVNPMGSCRAWSVYLTTLTGQA